MANNVCLIYLVLSALKSNAYSINESVTSESLTGVSYQTHQYDWFCHNIIVLTRDMRFHCTHFSDFAKRSTSPCLDKIVYSTVVILNYFGTEKKQLIKIMNIGQHKKKAKQKQTTAQLKQNRIE